jgi:hypothetical protein
MEASVGTQLILLELYLENLPASLPIPKHSAYNFSSFALDPDWLADVSEVGAIDGFGWVDMPQTDITGIEYQKFIADELNIDPSSPFLLDILSDQPRVLPLVPAATPVRVVSTQLSSSVPWEDEWETFPI